MAYQEIQNKQNGEKGLSARTKINTMFQELYAAVAGFVSSLGNYFTKTELSESGAGGAVHWENITNKRVGKLSDTDGDTYIDVESTADADFIKIQSGKTSGDILRLYDANGLLYFVIGAGFDGLFKKYYGYGLTSLSMSRDLLRSGGHVLQYAGEADINQITEQIFHYEARNADSKRCSFRAAEKNNNTTVNGKICFIDSNGDAPGGVGATFTNYTSFKANFALSKSASVMNGYKAFHATLPTGGTVTNAYAFVSEPGMKSGFGTNSPTEMVDVIGNIKTSGTIKANNLPIYADNITALAGGLVAGDVYRTSTGELRITI